MRQHSSQRLLSILQVLVLVFGISVISPTFHDGASAAPLSIFSGDLHCPHGGTTRLLMGHPISTACFYDTAHGGVRATWNSAYLWINPSLIASLDHINHSLWTYSGSPCNSWAEVGYTYPYRGDAQFYWYRARDYYDAATGADDYEDRPIQTVVQDNLNHAYWLRYDGSGSFTVYIDGAWKWQYTGLGYGSCVSSVGLEASQNLSANFYADTFNAINLQWANLGSPDTFNSGWNPSEYYIDNPCSSVSSPNCYNGLYYGPTQWSSNKP